MRSECVLVSTFVLHDDKFECLCTILHSFHFFLVCLHKRQSLQCDLVFHAVKYPNETEINKKKTIQFRHFIFNNYN